MLTELARVKGHEFMPDACSPDQRFVCVRAGLTLQVVDTRSGQVVRRWEKACSSESVHGLSLDGTRLVSHRPERGGVLEVWDDHGRLSCETGGRLMSWDGKPAKIYPSPQWGYADEYVGFTPDGAHIWLLTADTDGGLAVAFDARTLEEVDRARPWEYHFAESHMHTSPFDAEAVVGYRNAGDSCCYTPGFRVAGGRIQTLEPVLKARDADPAFIRNVKRGPDGLYVMTRDFILARLSWPDVESEVEVILDDEVDEDIGFFGDRVLLTTWNGEWNDQLVALDRATLEEVDRVPLKKPRGRCKSLRVLDGVLALPGASRTTFFRYTP